MISDPFFLTDFGVGYSGLATVGYRLSGQARTGTGVSELTPGSGIYGVSFSGKMDPGYLLWDTGTDPLRYSVEDVNTSFYPSVFKVANFGTSRTGLATVGVTIAGQRHVVLELLAGTGIYGGLITPPRGFVGQVIWDTGEDPGQIRYAADFLNEGFILLGYFETASYIMKKLGRDMGILELR